MDSRRLIGLLALVIILSAFFPVKKGYLFAPELIQGNIASINTPLHIGLVDGGDWRAVMIGARVGKTEKGFIFRVAGVNIDNENKPVPYSITWLNPHRFIGKIIYRGHERKICGANTRDNLPCK